MKQYIFLSLIVISVFYSLVQSGDATTTTNAFAAADDYALEPTHVSLENGVPMFRLANGNNIPLVGLGVGDTQQYLVPLLVAGGIQENKKIRLFDTSHVSDNERLVAEGIAQGIKRMNILENDDDNNEKIEVHVVTKVWYTHLGYERTKLSVKKSIEHLQSAVDNEKVDLKVHVLIHWPRCYDSISWMNCEEEESNLPDDVKQAGPAPHTSKQDAWKKSWMALEDMYESQEYPIASIGVSNFQVLEMEQFKDFARIYPQILQMNVWSLLYDPYLVQFCQEHNIHVQVFNVMTFVMNDPHRAPNAHRLLQQVANELSQGLPDELSVAQVVLAWLIQHGVSVVPKTSRLSRLEENSARALATIPEMSAFQAESIAHAVEAYMSGVDMDINLKVSVTFEAESRDLMIFWKRPDGDEVHVAYLPEGQTFNETTYPNHNYVVYDAQDKDTFVQYQVQSNYGEHEYVSF